MNRREAAIITAYTGIMATDFDSFHKYAEEVMGRPIWTHEFSVKAVWDELKEAALEDFLGLCREATSLPKEEWEMRKAEYSDDAYAEGVKSMMANLPKEKPVAFVEVEGD